VAGKSTVPVGTAAGLAPRVAETGATLVWNPEFLREGFAVKDTIDPDRLVVGLAPGHEEAADVLREVYAPAVAKGTPFIVTDLATAELVKVAANAFLATKISFINAMAEIAEVTGADVTQLADAIGHDVRIGRRFLGAGIGFGGGCLPKDIRAFSARAEGSGAASRSRSCARSTRSTCAAAIAPCSWSSRGSAVRCSRRRWRCWAPRSSRTDDIRDSPPWMSRCGCTASGRRRGDRPGGARQRGARPPAADVRGIPR
jgi:hypothetical protein